MNAPMKIVVARWPMAVALPMLLLLSACGSKQAAAPAPEEEAAPAGEGGLVLDKEQIDKLGVVTQPAKAASFAAELSGYGQVLGHESIALMTAEIATASAAARQSQAALTRVQKLAGTPG